jgi:hypothetical protein
MERKFIILFACIGVALAVLTVFLLRKEKPCAGPVTCTTDDQCGGTIVADRFCRDGNVYGNGQVNTCANSGTCTAVCQTTYGAVLIEECDTDCVNGVCVN